MSDQSRSEHHLVRYLLGQLSEAEQHEIEARFISDEEYCQQLLLVEDELRCAYAQGSLPAADRNEFERRFLIFPDERRRVELATAMIKELSSGERESAFLPADTPRDEKSWWAGVLAALGFGAPAMRFALATAAAVLLVASAWLIFDASRLREQISELQARQAARDQESGQRSAEERSHLEQLNKELEEERNSRAVLEKELAQSGQPPTRDEVRPTIVSLLLGAGLVRGGGETKTLTVPKGPVQIRLLLNIEEKGSHRSYQAVILDPDGRQVWSRKGLSPTQARGAQFLVLRIPAQVLAEDDYQIRLSGLTQAGEPERVGDYYFTVLKK